MEFVVHERGSAVQRFPLDEGETFVGRGEENRVVLSAAKISGEHLVLRRSGDTLMLEDLESTNGTFVNGRRSAGRIEVFRGDRIYLGDYVAWVEGGLASRDISDEAHTVSEDALLMASRPPPGLKGAPRAFLEEGEAYRLRLEALVRAGLAAHAATGVVMTEETLRQNVPAPAGPQGETSVDDARCCADASKLLHLATNFTTDALHEDWAAFSLREGARPLVLDADGGRVGWREPGGGVSSPVTREVIETLVRRLVTPLGLHDAYVEAGEIEAFDDAGGYLWGFCDPSGHQAAALDLRRRRPNAVFGIGTEGWARVVNDLVAPTRTALAAGGRVLWALRGAIPAMEAIHELLAGIRTTGQAVCVSETGALGRGRAQVDAFARARSIGGDALLTSRICGRFDSGCGLFISHLWREGSPDSEAIREALCGAGGGTLVTVWADSIEDGERALARGIGDDVVPTKFDVALSVRRTSDDRIEIDGVWDPAFVAEGEARP